MSTQVLTYCGGMSEIQKSCDLAINAMPDHVGVYKGILKSYKIPYTAISNISIKTNEQISKDVTLSRLLLIGIFALGAKKKTKEVANYLVIDYSDCGITTSAIFSGKHAPKMCSEILAARKSYYEKHPEVFSTQLNEAETPTGASVASPQMSDDTAAEIEKFYELKEKGVITDKEFTAKKAQLLGI